MLILSSPSGGGKGTAVEHLLKSQKFTLSVSCTTRTKTEKETDGVDYYFITIDEFFKRAAKGDFLEHKEVYPGVFYGTPKSEVSRAKEEKRILLLDIDVDGARGVRETGETALYAFIDSGDDLEVYRERIIRRGREEGGEIEKRIARIPYELARGRKDADLRIRNYGSIEKYHYNLKIFLFLEEIKYLS